MDRETGPDLGDDEQADAIRSYERYVEDPREWEGEEDSRPAEEAAMHVLDPEHPDRTAEDFF